MAISDTLKFTVDDYQRMPDDGKHYEVIRGELIMSPSPNRFHQEISGNLEFIIRLHLKNRPSGKLYHAPFDVVLSNYDVLQPDLAYFSKPNWNRLTQAGATGAPDYVAEILSPANAVLDRNQKRRLYAEHGVVDYWIIDPQVRTIEIYRLAEDAVKPQPILRENDRFESPIFPGLIFDADEIFKE